MKGSRSTQRDFAPTVIARRTAITKAVSVAMASGPSVHA
jgi:hypothetical protein